MSATNLLINKDAILDNITMTDATVSHDALTLRDEAVQFKRVFDEQLLAFVDSERERYHTITDNTRLHQLFTQLRAVCTGGKRLRPFMVHTLYSRLQSQTDRKDITDILLAVELFHIFCLIHDDIMDEAPRRHGVATLHQFATTELYSHAQPHTRTRSSESQAILVGDIVFNMVFRLLASAESKTIPHSDEVRTIFHTLIDEVCIGQMLDIDLTTETTVSEAAVIAKSRLKTAYYSFVRPLHLGTILAGRPDLLPFIERFGESAGLLYQAEDDLLDIIGDPAVTKKETFTDVTQNQHTIPSTYLRAQGGTAATLLDTLSGTTLTDTDKTALKAAFMNSGAIHYTEALIETYINQATASFDEFTLSETERTIFASLLALVYKRSS